MEVERYVEFDVVDEIVRDAIVAEANGLSDRCAHGRALSKLWIAAGDQAGAEPIIAAGVNVEPVATQGLLQIGLAALRRW